MELGSIAQRIRTTLTGNFGIYLDFKEMAKLGREMPGNLAAGEVEAALQSGQLKLWDAPCENCFEYMKAYLDGKGSLFPQDRRETLAKQIIVAMSEQLANWCGEEKIFSTKEQAWRALEKLLGRTRRMLDIWKKEVGAAGFYAAN